ncbi:MAG: lipoate--protein ligase [Pseudomonadota bacterium]
MHNKYKIYLSESLDPRFNLSVEELLMNCSEPDEVLLFLWQNENTIVIGRNQNPFKECDVKRLKADDVRLIRRLSGGGAVYHDLGNLNFSFIASDKNHDIEQNMKIVLNSIAQFGIQGHFTGRNDLMTQGRKFSGNAFFSEKGMNCHHGTLLVDVDLDKLSRYLTVPPIKLQSKGIESVASRVVNLKELCPRIDIARLRSALISSFIEFYNTEAQVIVLNEKAIDISKYIGKYDSWEWNYGESPDFSMVVEEKFDWGILEIHLELSDGKVKNCRIFTDSIEPEDFSSMERLLRGRNFVANDIIKVIGECIKNEKIRQELCYYVKYKLCII